MFQGSFKEVSRKFQECFKKVSMVFRKSLKGVSRKIKGCLNKVSFGSGCKKLKILGDPST